MEKYNIGQIIKYENETTLEGVFGKHATIKKGTKSYIGADKRPKFSHFLDSTMLILKDDTEIEGYSVEGIADWIYEWVSARINLDDGLDDYDVTVKEFKEHVADALEELGMWDNTGNRS